ncbi:hypothetical protein AB0D24_40845 [Streptomyces javensis]|uniref:hypothetical protein n=1 Tax=Streptomyces javensis TaxID=114698 RepID=UPI00340BA3E1
MRRKGSPLPKGPSIFVVTQVPETRGVSLEKLAEDVTSGAVYGFGKAGRVA